MKGKLSKSKIKEIIEEKELIKSEPRFAHVFTDPRYKNLKKKKDKILLDTRFHSITVDTAFSEKTTIDPRGYKQQFLAKEDLMKFYRLDSSESENEEAESDADISDQLIQSDIEESDNESITTERTNLPNTIKKTERSIMNDTEKDYAREVFFSDSSDDDSSTDDEIEEESEPSGIDSDSDSNEADVKETRRIAVLHANWDYIKASDIMVMVSSFTSLSGNVNKVSVYLSNYGKEKLQEEEEHGPQLFLNNEEDTQTEEYLNKLENGEINDDGTLSDEQLRAFRKYQLRKLKYYYAIVDCDSIETAISIYKQCNKSSIGTIGNSIDLRYVLDETEFDEVPIDVCEGTPDGYEYTSYNSSDTKQMTNWDETDPKRTRIMEDVMKKAMKGETIEEDALKDYIGSGSSSEDLDDVTNENTLLKRNKIKKLRKLLKKIDTKGELSDCDLNSNDSGSDDEDVHMIEKFEVSSNKIINQSEKGINKEDDKNDTTSDKTDLGLLLMDDNNEDEHFNMRDIVKESNKKLKIRKNKWEKMKIDKKREIPINKDNFKINLDDDIRFAMIHDGQYNIERNHPSYKRTALMDNLLNELPAKRRKHNAKSKGVIV